MDSLESLTDVRVTEEAEPLLVTSVEFRSVCFFGFFLNIHFECSNPFGRQGERPLWTSLPFPLSFFS